MCKHCHSTKPIVGGTEDFCSVQCECEYSIMIAMVDYYYTQTFDTYSSLKVGHAANIYVHLHI